MLAMYWSALCMLWQCKVKHIKENLLWSFSSVGIFSTASEALVLILYLSNIYNSQLSSNSIKINLCLLFWKKIVAESLWPPPKFQVNIKIQLNLSVSYYYGKSYTRRIFFKYNILHCLALFYLVNLFANFTCKWLVCYCRALFIAPTNILFFSLLPHK